MRLPFTCLNLIGTNVGMLTEPEAQQIDAVNERHPIRIVLVVGIQHGNARPRFSAKNFRFRVCDAFNRTESLKVGGSRVRNDNNIWFGKLSQVSDLAGMIGAHLEHCVFM